MTTTDTLERPPADPTDDVRGIVREVLRDEFGSLLDDLSFRISQAYDVVGRADAAPREGRVYAEDLNLLGRAFLTGYEVTDNAPAAGSIAWTDLHIVFAGQDYPITNGNTNLRYAWWSPTTTPGVLQTSNTKPSLKQGEVLVLMNNGGIHKVMLSDTNASLPGVVSDGAVDQAAILANAVGSTQLADGAVGRAQVGANAIDGTKLADGAINRAGQLSGGVVSTGALAANAVDGTKLADGAVTRSGQLGSNVVDGTKLANGAVSRADQLGANVVTQAKVADGAIARSAQMATGVVATGQLAANAVDGTKLADGAVTRAGQLGASVVTDQKLAANAVTKDKVANGAIDRAAQMGANVVTNTQIANGAVGNPNLQPGAVGADKLSILRHIIY